jgi:hypothetical protein
VINEPASSPESHAHRTPVRKPAAGKPAAARPHFSRPAHRDRKPAAVESNRPARRGADARSAAPRNAGTSRWNQNGSKSSNGSAKGAHAASSNGSRSNGSHANGSRNGNSSSPSWGKNNGHSKVVKAGSKTAVSGRKARPESRTDVRGNRKPALTTGAKAGNSKRFGFTARPNRGTKKRG